MSHFARIDENSTVTQVIVAEQEFIDTGAVGDPSNWIQTSYNTRAGVHYGADGQPDSGVALRKNYAGIGYSYDSERDAFIPPKPFASWNLNETSCTWDPPVAYPTDSEHMYSWDEATTSWKQEELPA